MLTFAVLTAHKSACPQRENEEARQRLRRLIDGARLDGTIGAIYSARGLTREWGEEPGYVVTSWETSGSLDAVAVSLAARFDQDTVLVSRGLIDVTAGRLTHKATGYTLVNLGAERSLEDWNLHLVRQAVGRFDIEACTVYYGENADVWALIVDLVPVQVPTLNVPVVPDPEAVLVS